MSLVLEDLDDASAKIVVQVIDQFKRYEKENTELQRLKDEAEEACEGYAVTQSLTRKNEEQEEYIKLLLQDKESSDMINILPLRTRITNNKILEYIIRNSLGCKLTLGTNLLSIVCEKVNCGCKYINIYKPSDTVNDNYALGWETFNDRCEHKRFDYDAQNCEKSCKNNFDVLDLFSDMYPSSKRPILRTRKGGIHYKYVDRKYYMVNSMLEDNYIWENHPGIDLGGKGTRQISYEILTNIYK